MGKNNIVKSVLVSEETEMALRRRAFEERISQSKLIRAAILIYLGRRPRD